MKRRAGLAARLPLKPGAIAIGIHRALQPEAVSGRKLAVDGGDHRLQPFMAFAPAMRVEIDRIAGIGFRDKRAAFTGIALVPGGEITGDSIVCIDHDFLLHGGIGGCHMRRSVPPAAA